MPDSSLWIIVAGVLGTVIAAAITAWATTQAQKKPGDAAFVTAVNAVTKTALDALQTDLANTKTECIALRAEGAALRAEGTALRMEGEKLRREIASVQQAHVDCERRLLDLEADRDERAILKGLLDQVPDYSPTDLKRPKPKGKS